MQPGGDKAVARVISKGELCVALNWSRPRLERRLESDANFPVRRRGTKGGGWEFDLKEVFTYLKTGKVPKRQAILPANEAPAVD